MLTPSDEAFLASIDWHSLRQSAEQVAQPHREVVDDMRASFTDVPVECGGTRIRLGHEIAKADDMDALARAAGLFATDMAGALAVLTRAFLADESSGRPSAEIVPLRAQQATRPLSKPPVSRRDLQL